MLSKNTDIETSKKIEALSKFTFKTVVTPYDTSTRLDFSSSQNHTSERGPRIPGSGRVMRWTFSRFVCLGNTPVRFLDYIRRQCFFCVFSTPPPIVRPDLGSRFPSLRLVFIRPFAGSVGRGRNANANICRCERKHLSTRTHAAAVDLQTWHGSYADVEKPDENNRLCVNKPSRPAFYGWHDAYPAPCKPEEKCMIFTPDRPAGGNEITSDVLTNGQRRELHVLVVRSSTPRD